METASNEFQFILKIDGMKKGQTSDEGGTKFHYYWDKEKGSLYFTADQSGTVNITYTYNGRRFNYGSETREFEIS